MKGPIADEEAKIKSAPKISSTISIGISHHLFARHRNSNSSPMIPSFLFSVSKVFFMSGPPAFHFFIFVLKQDQP
jgi:hypothetical protein